jgi:hypothetical protein
VWARPTGGYSIPTLATRTLSALAYERGEEYDPSLPPISPSEIDVLAPVEHAQPIIGEPATMSAVGAHSASAGAPSASSTGSRSGFRRGT